MLAIVNKNLAGWTSLIHTRIVVLIVLVLALERVESFDDEKEDQGELPTPTISFQSGGYPLIVRHGRAAT
jgi:hypothetical protein